MRIVLWSLAAVFALTAAAPPDQNRQQTFVVEVCDRPGHAAAIGAGVVVAKDAATLTLATAAHVVTQKGTLLILDDSRTAFYEVLATQVLPDYDLALVRVRAHDQFFVTPATLAQPVAGEQVRIWGHADQSFWSLALGTVRETNAQIPGTSGGSRITIECAACDHGDSGSGVFDAQGRLIGIVTRAWRKKSGGPVLFIEVEPAAIVAREVLATR
jgi:S1-C subfamily serine protease